MKSFKQEQSGFYTEERFGTSGAEMRETFARIYPHIIRLGGWNGDFGMGAAQYRMHLPDPTAAEWNYGMAISHHRSANNPVGFNPSLTEYMELEIDITPYEMRKIAEQLNKYADRMDEATAIRKQARIDGTPDLG